MNDKLRLTATKITQNCLKGLFLSSNFKPKVISITRFQSNDLKNSSHFPAFLLVQRALGRMKCSKNVSQAKNYACPFSTSATQLASLVSTHRKINVHSFRHFQTVVSESQIFRKNKKFDAFG